MSLKLQKGGEENLSPSHEGGNKSNLDKRMFPVKIVRPIFISECYVTSIARVIKEMQQCTHDRI
jgi:hypothetical protein